jgi:putative tryptophan/tyrosine transport system substrate-binding protein
MRRREFITLLGGAAAAWPLAARAQQAAMPVIGFLGGNSPGRMASIITRFREGLKRAGYVEGRNVVIDFSWTEGQIDRLAELATELVRRRVAVIAIPGNTAAALAAKAVTSTIPIVFSVGGDPVRLGLVASLSRPGGNATGFAEMNTEVAPRRLGIMHDLVPAARRFALLVEAGAPISESVVADLRAATSSIGGQIDVIVVPGTLHDVDLAFATLAQKRVEALLVNPSAQFYGLGTQFHAATARNALPAIYWARQLAEAGGLMSYGSNIFDQFHQVGVYVGRVLNGEKPADLPVQLPTKYEFVINLKTAKALGLTVPRSCSRSPTR